MSTSATEKSAFTDLAVKMIALIVVVLGLTLMGGWSEAGLFGKGLRPIACVLLIGIGIGFFTYQGWAFLFVSAGLLLGFFFTFIKYLLAWDHALLGQADQRTLWLCAWIGIMVLIGFVGRWKTERHFRPHLDVDHH